MTQTMLDLPDDSLSQPQTPVTMERAFAFGFKAGLGFIAAQVMLGILVGILYVVVVWTMPGR